jgi:hypothetical protein
MLENSAVSEQLNTIPFMFFLTKSSFVVRCAIQINLKNKKKIVQNWYQSLEKDSLGHGYLHVSREAMQYLEERKCWQCPLTLDYSDTYV